MLICCCGEHNTPGDQICPGDCRAVQATRLECALEGHACESNIDNLRPGQERTIGPVPPGETCLVCGETG